MTHAIPRLPPATAPPVRGGGRPGCGSAPIPAPGAEPRDHLLILRFALVNLLGLALLGAAWAEGLVARAVSADATHLSVVIFAVFLGGLAHCAWLVRHTSVDLDEIGRFDPRRATRTARYIASLRGCHATSRTLLAASLRLKLAQRIAPVRHVAGSLVLLGLIGTVLGFIIALSGVDPARAADVTAVAPMISTLISGMSTALYTTLIGSLFNVWLMINYQLLAGGTVKLITGVVALGERHAGA